MKKAELEKALQKPKSFPAVRKVFPEKVAAVVDLSFDSLNSWFQGMKKKVNLNLKEKAREKLLKLNAKIKEMLEKPEFEWEEKQDWEDQLLWSGEKKVIPQKDF